MTADSADPAKQTGYVTKMEQRKKPVLGQIPVAVTELKRQQKENLCSLKKRRFLDRTDGGLLYRPATV
jgi:hypothetical protein